MEEIENPYPVNLEERYHVRDCYSKKVKVTYRGLEAAKQFMTNIPFGNANFLEIYDSKDKEVVFEHIRHRRGHDKFKVFTDEVLL